MEPWDHPTFGICETCGLEQVVAYTTKDACEQCGGFVFYWDNMSNSPKDTVAVEAFLRRDRFWDDSKLERLEVLLTERDTGRG